jgi:hypothetical protein
MIISRWILVRIGTVSGEVLEKIRTQIVCSITFSWKSCRLWDRRNVEKYGISWQTTEDTVLRCMRFACWVGKATYTHLACVILLLFHGNNGYANAPECCIYTCVACAINFTFNVDEGESPDTEWLQRKFLNQLSKHLLLKKTLHLGFRYLRNIGGLVCDKMQEIFMKSVTEHCRPKRGWCWSLQRAVRSLRHAAEPNWQDCFVTWFVHSKVILLHKRQFWIEGKWVKVVSKLN